MPQWRRHRANATANLRARGSRRSRSNRLFRMVPRVIPFVRRRRAAAAIQAAFRAHSRRYRPITPMDRVAAAFR